MYSDDFEITEPRHHAENILAQNCCPCRSTRLTTISITMMGDDDENLFAAAKEARY